MIRCNSPLFARLREHFRRRDRLRLVISYRRKYLESLVRQGEEEAGKIAQEYRQASAQQEREYAETAAALAEKQELTAEEAAEVSQLWRKLVKLFHPDRFAHEPEKQETYHRLTAAINHAKDHGDLATLRGIAEDHRGTIGLHPAARLGAARLRRGARDRATAPPVGEPLRQAQGPEPAEGHRAGNQPRAGGGKCAQGEPRLRAAPADDADPAFFDETVGRHVEALEKELGLLEREADGLAKEITELTGETVPGIE